MTTSPQTETIREFDAFTGAWRDVKVPVTPPETLRHTVTGIPAHYGTSPHAGCPRCVPVTRTASRRHGAPRDLSGLSDAAPLPPWWRDTAFAPGEPLADMREWIKPPAMRTRRVPPVMPAKDLGEITDTSRQR